MSVRTERFDPDTVAALEEERSFLLRSIADLDAELAAGDIDEHDYDELKDDYTRRAADVIRALEAQQELAPTRRPVQWRRVAIWLVGLALLGGVSGALIARSSGARSGNEAITGGVRASAETRLNQARALLGDREAWDDAIELYDSVLDEDPSSVEALTYRAWLQYRRGDDPAGPLADLDEVARLDEGYPDAVVFQTIVLADQGSYDSAAAALDRLDLDAAPDGVRALLDQRGLLGEVYGEAHYATLVATTPTLADLGLSVDAALAAAGYLLAGEKENRTVAALKLYDAVEEVDADNAAALSRQAILLAFTGDPELGRRALELVDRALEANPGDPEALLSRATVVISTGGDAGAACADLDDVLGADGVADAIVSQAERLRASSCPA